MTSNPSKKSLSQAKTYYWCSCGHSKNPPFCDVKSVPFCPPTDGEYFLCECKATKTPPYCDGSHATLCDISQQKDPS